MKILLLGHTSSTEFLAKQLAAHPSAKKVYHFGADSTSKIEGKYFPIIVDLKRPDISRFILNCVEKADVDLIIPMLAFHQIWPEFHQTLEKKGIPYLMPSPEHGLLEFSKIKTKKILEQIEIPTPKYQILSLEEVLEYFKDITRPFVLKYDQDWRNGLQTVVITDDNVDSEYEYICQEGNKRVTPGLGDFINQQFIIEEFLKGSREYSYHALCNSTGWSYIGSARDYKKRFDGDQGFNTSGMGAYSLKDKINPIVHSYTEKILNYLKSEGMSYKGFLYLGIMEDQNGNPHVLEINTRAGDPEINTILSVIENDVLDLLYKTALNQKIDPVLFNSVESVAIRTVNKDYDIHKCNSKRVFVDTVPSDIIQNKNTGDPTVSNSVFTCTADSVEEASNKLYNFLKDIDFKDYTYRTDIGYLK